MWAEKKMDARTELNVQWGVKDKLRYFVFDKTNKHCCLLIFIAVCFWLCDFVWFLFLDPNQNLCVPSTSSTALFIPHFSPCVHYIHLKFDSKLSVEFGCHRIWLLSFNNTIDGSILTKLHTHFNFFFLAFIFVQCKWVQRFQWFMFDLFSFFFGLFADGRTSTRYTIFRCN